MAFGDGVVHRRVASHVLQVHMGAALDERFGHVEVAFVDGDVERRLASFVARIYVNLNFELVERDEQLDHFGLVAISRMMNGSIAVLVLLF